MKVSVDINVIGWLGPTCNSIYFSQNGFGLLKENTKKLAHAIKYFVIKYIKALCRTQQRTITFFISSTHNF